MSKPTLLTRKRTAPSLRPSPPSGQRAGFLDRLTVSQKLGLAAALFMVPLVVLGITDVQSRANALAPVLRSKDILPIAENVDQVRIGLSNFSRIAMNAQLKRNTPAEIQSSRQKVDESIAALKASLANKNSPGFLSELPKMRRELTNNNVLGLDLVDFSWEYLRGNAPVTPTFGNISNDYEALLKSLDAMIKEIGRVSGLRLGGGRPSLFILQKTMYDTLGELRKNITMADFLGESVIRGSADESGTSLPGGGDPDQDLTKLSELMPLITRDKNVLINDLDTAVKTGMTVSKNLIDQVEKVNVSIESIISDLENVRSSETPVRFNDDIKDALNDIQVLRDQVYSAFVKEAQAIQRQETDRTVFSMTIVGLLTLLALGLLFYILRSIIQNLRLLTAGSQRLNEGEVGVQVPITSQDELGVLARTFNAASNELKANFMRVEQERVEATQLQNNIGAFLDVTMDIAEGDLTKRGAVTEDILGNVVDSINLMTEELGQTLKGVRKASESVTGGSRAMLVTTEQINQGSVMTVHEAQLAARRAVEVNANIQHMAQVAQASAEAARQAMIAAYQGQQAVVTTLQGMENIRHSSQSVSERVQTLGKRSEEIQEIVDSITQIASQTNLLALHASIEAAGAGEAGTRFSVVAEEVRQLADLSTEATNRIATLIAGIQTEIRQVVQSMRENTSEVEQGYRVAGTAGERLREIGAYVQESARLAEDISLATQEQVQGVEQMGRAVQQIATIAQESQHSVQQGRSAAEQLQSLADQLNVSLARFRLPN